MQPVLRRRLASPARPRHNITLRGVEPAEALAYASRVRAVQGPAATTALGRLLQPSRVSLVIVGDSAKFIEPLRKLRPDTVVVAADKLDLATASEIASN